MLLGAPGIATRSKKLVPVVALAFSEAAALYSQDSAVRPAREAAALARKMGDKQPGTPDVGPWKIMELLHCTLCDTEGST